MTSPLLLVELDWEARVHLFFALEAHLARCRDRYPIPPAIEALYEQLAATTGQGRTRVADSPPPPHPDAVLLTYEEAGDRLAVSERTVRRLVASGELRAARPAGGRARRIHVEDLEAYARRAREGGTP